MQLDRPRSRGQAGTLGMNKLRSVGRPLVKVIHSTLYRDRLSSTDHRYPKHTAKGLGLIQNPESRIMSLQNRTEEQLSSQGTKLYTGSFLPFEMRFSQREKVGVVVALEAEVHYLENMSTRDSRKRQRRVTKLEAHLFGNRHRPQNHMQNTIHRDNNTTRMASLSVLVFGQCFP